MSHVASVQVEFKDLECLKKAAEECGLEFMEGQTNFKWYGRFMNDYHGSDAAVTQGFDPKEFGKCLHALRVKGNDQAYEIGVVKNPNGDGYRLLFDYWNGGFGLMELVAGASDKSQHGIGKLHQHYTAEVTMKSLRKQGHSFGKPVWVDGKLEITATEKVKIGR